MSYQVLARKWRPKSFQEMVGQEHVLKALIHALEHKRLHHAYLFTGTRGVGKTTIGRILAKCLNCETGIVAVPCEQCSACLEVGEGRFVDLIEIDAASRTKVEDMRELLENVQYSPTRGRFKVYLIDEVHMLSTSSFNALLKTLEEPPEHVKFLLATTDPQKLPVTILSRCLQFNLKNMAPERIVGHLAHILKNERIPFDENALWLLARSADGSMRDALSLTDQSIAYGNGNILEQQVSEMLGTVGHKQIIGLVKAIGSLDARLVLDTVAQIGEFSPDYESVLSQLISIFHRIAIEQAVPGATDNTFGDQSEILALAGAFTAEDVQVFYQISLIGRKDLAITPDRRAGFEMVLLRMIAFRPNVKSKDELTPLTPVASSTDDSSTIVNTAPASSTLPTNSDQSEHAGTALSTNDANSTQVNTTQNRDSNTTIPSPPGYKEQTNTTQTAVVHKTTTAQTTATQTTNAQSSEPASVPSRAPESQLSSGINPASGNQAVNNDGPPPGHPAYSGDGSDAPLQDDYQSMADSLPEYDDANLDPGYDAGYVSPKVSSGVSNGMAQKKTVIEEVREPSIPEISSVSASDDVAVSGGEVLEEVAATSSNQPFDWVADIDELGLGGMTLNIAANSGFDLTGDQITLYVDEGNYRLLTRPHQDRIVEALKNRLGRQFNVNFISQAPTAETPSQRKTKNKAARLQLAIDTIRQDDNVRQIIELFNATVIEKTVEPID